MATTKIQLKVDALELDPVERQALAAEVLLNLDEADSQTIEAAWLAEARRRDAAATLRLSRFLSRILLGVFFCLILAGCDTSVSAGVTKSDLPATKPAVLTPDNLLQLLPVLSNQRDDGHVYSIDGKLPLGEMNLSFHACIGRSGRFLIVVCDASDNAPLFAAAQGKLVVYDLIGGYVVYAVTRYITFDISCSPDKLNVNWTVHDIENDGKFGECRFDFPSMFSGVPQLHMTATEKGPYILSGETKSGTTVVACIEPERVPPILSLSATHGHEDVLIVDKVAKVDDVDGSCWKFPAEAVLKRQLTVKKWEELNDLEKERYIAMGLFSLAARRAFNHADSRAMIEGKFGAQDWEELKRKDLENSQKLRSLFSIDAPAQKKN